MKNLFIVRHAKAEKILPGGSDFERPLAKRGISDAATMAERLVNKRLKADCIISSPANRAKTTAMIFAEVLHYPIDHIVFEESIYEAWAEDLVSVIRAVENEHAQVLLFGHNPAFSTLVTLLSKTELESLPTCGIAHIQFPDLKNWSELKAGTGRLVEVDFPKNPEY